MPLPKGVELEPEPLRSVIERALSVAAIPSTVGAPTRTADTVERAVVGWLQLCYPIPSVWKASKVASLFRAIAKAARKASEENASGEILIRIRVHSGELVEVRMGSDERVA